MQAEPIATCGGGGISPTFGASLWLLDYVFQAVLLGYERLHFHQGKLGMMAIADLDRHYRQLAILILGSRQGVRTLLRCANSFRA